MVRVEHAQAIRPHHPHPAGAADFDQLLFGLRARGADFLETGRDDDDRFGARFNRTLEGVFHVFGPHHDDAEVYGTLVLADGFVTFEAKNFIRLGIDRNNRPFVAVVDKIGQHRVTHLARVAGSTDHRDGLGI